MVHTYSTGVLLAFVAAALVAGCEGEEGDASSATTSSQATSEATGNEEARKALQPEDPSSSLDKPASVERPPPEWTLEASGAFAFDKRGRSAAFTYRDQALHMRLLYNPSGGGFGQGVTFHLPNVALGQTGPVKASYANFVFEDEGLRCTSRGENTHFAVELTEFNRDVRAGSFEGRLVCHPLEKEAKGGDDEEPKYAEVSGRFRHD